MATSITRFLFAIPAVILLCFLALQLREPSGQTVNHWILLTELKNGISSLGNGDWHRAWLHLGRSLTQEGYILVALFISTLLGVKHYFSERNRLAQAAESEIEELKREANRLGNIGLECSESGKIEQAIDYYKQSLAISRQIEDHQVAGTTLGNLGNAYLALGEINKAIGLHEQALAIFRQIGYPHGEASVLGNLGKTYSACGQVEKAIKYNRQSLSLFEQMHSPYAQQMRQWLAELENQSKPAGN